MNMCVCVYLYVCGDGGVYVWGACVRARARVRGSIYIGIYVLMTLSILHQILIFQNGKIITKDIA